MRTNFLISTLLPLLALVGCDGAINKDIALDTAIGVDGDTDTDTNVDTDTGDTSGDTGDTSDTGEPAAVPDITVDPLSLDLGAAGPGDVLQGTITIGNIGAGALDATAAVTMGDPAFTIDTTAIALLDGETSVVTVSFVAADDGVYSGQLTLTSNDPDEPTVVVSIAAVVDSVGDDDVDNDGYVVGEDCDDTDAYINPGAEEIWYDGIDENCDGRSDYDSDADGYESADYGGDDCDDTNAAVNLGTLEDPTNGIDDDCDGTIDEALSVTDVDGDGYTEADGDCNDADASVNPAAIEAWYDGVDQDCSGGSDYDADYDAEDSDLYGGADCDDTNAAVGPGMPELLDNGLDDDCDGTVDGTGMPSDLDGDGYLATVDDCNDLDPAVNPGMTEIWYDGVDEDCSGGSDYDQDGDGYIASAYGGDDCSDTNAAINPGAVEVWYDGTDQDCSGGSDYDRDGDGVTTSTYGGLDCDDADAAVSPSATEVCDGIDNDCDGSADEGVATTYYADADADGYGLVVSSTSACSAPTGYTTTAGDCDDSLSSVNPGAAETCNSRDDDCDGLVDDGVTTTWYVDADGDTYGSASTSVSTCTPPTGYVADATDCDDADATSNPGATEIAYDVTDNDCDGYQDDMVAADESGWTVLGARSSDGIGSWGVHATEDLDGDGDPELVICAGSANTSTRTDAGYLAFHDMDTAGIGVALTSGYYAYYGAESSDFVGSSFAIVDDLDGDGNTEIAVGSYQNDSNESADGQVYLFDVDGQTGFDQASSGDADGVVRGNSDNGYLGYAMAAGDFDGDGTNDLATGAPGEQSSRGRVYVTFDSDELGTNDIDGTDSNFYVSGVSDGDHLGYSVVFGDLTDDGYDDLVACSPDDDDTASAAGTCWVVAGASTRGSSTSVRGTTISSLDTAVITGSAASDQVGYTPQSLSVGDIDDDGVVDLAVGVPGYDGASSGGGGIWVYSGGTLSGSETVATATYVVNGDGALGMAVNMTGDITRDGVVDLLGGATTAGGNIGVVYLLEGGLAPGLYTLPDDQYASWIGEAAGDAFGAAISGMQDLDGDGRQDFAVAASGSDESASNAGKVYVIPAYP